MWPFLLTIIVVSILITDITQRRINNYQVLAVFILSLASTGFTAVAPVPLLIATIIGLLLFGFGFFAGGDIKLMLAFLPAISTVWWLPVLVLMAFMGGVMALGYLGYGWLGGRMKQVRERGLPYGVPVAIAGLGGVWLSSF